MLGHVEGVGVPVLDHAPLVAADARLILVVVLWCASNESQHNNKSHCNIESRERETRGREEGEKANSNASDRRLVDLVEHNDRHATLGTIRLEDVDLTVLA